MGKVLAATANIFFSVVLGAIALALVAVESPNTMDMFLGWGSWVRDQVTTTNLEPKYNIWVKFLIADQQLVFLGFVIVTRIILSVITTGAARLLGFGRD